MRLWKRRLLNPLVTSGIAIIVWQWLLPVLVRWGWALLKIAYQSISDGIYQSAAQGFGNEVIIQIYGMTTSICTGIWLGFATALARRKFSRTQSDKGTFWKFWHSTTVPLVFGFIIVMMLTVDFAHHFVKQQLLSSFQQRFTILAPSLSEQEEENILADWAKMRSGVDHEELNMKMEGTAKERGVKLPKPLWK